MTRCASCEGEQGRGGGETCPDCGSGAVVQTCPRCGEAFADSDTCPACGRAVAEFRCESHPDRVARGRCVICERPICRECTYAEGRAMLCEEHAGIPVIQGWAQIYGSTSEFEARLVLENLAAEGIDARLFSQKDAMLSVDLGELSIVRLLVPAWEFTRATEVIRGHTDDEGDVSFACANCGEAYDPGASSCRACGERLATSAPD